MSNTETLLKTENQQSAEKVLEFLNELNPEEKQKFMSFIQGVRFAKSSAAEGSRPA